MAVLLRTATLGASTVVRGDRGSGFRLSRCANDPSHGFDDLFRTSPARGDPEVQEEDRDRDPHDREPDPAFERHVLTAEHHPDDELHDRGDELDHPDEGEGDATGSRGEEQQRHRGRHPREGEEHGVQRPGGAERDPPVRGDENQLQNGDRDEPERLQRQPAHGVDSGADLLLDQPVDAEGGGEREGDPREGPVREDDHQHGHRGDPDRCPLQRPEPLVQHEDAEEHHRDRVDEISEARLDDVAREGGQDEHLPVDVDQQTREGREGEQPRLTDDGAQRRPSARDREQDRAEDERQQDPPGDELPRSCRG
ncbi:hypothetical protein ABE10_05870, partial [Bacillus toyonensis]|nr:hypothetical protein [Bacillus toyonensis]